MEVKVLAPGGALRQPLHRCGSTRTRCHQRRKRTSGSGTRTLRQARSAVNAGILPAEGARQGLGLPSLLGRFGPPVGDEGIHAAWLAVPAFPGKRLGFCDGRLKGVSGAWTSRVRAFSVSPASGVRCRRGGRRSRARHRQARGSKSSLLIGSCLSHWLRISMSTRCEERWGAGLVANSRPVIAGRLLHRLRQVVREVIRGPSDHEVILSLDLYRWSPCGIRQL